MSRSGKGGMRGLVLIILIPMIVALAGLIGLRSLEQKVNEQNCKTGTGVNLQPVDFASQAKTSPLKAQQIANAETAVGVAYGHTEFTPDERYRLAIIVYIVGRTETNFTNYKTYTDHDSLGIHAQRAGWGSVAQRTNPAQSTELLINGGKGGQDGILDFQMWQTMPPGEVAWKVQQPYHLYRGRYATHIAEAKAFLGKGLPTGTEASFAAAVVSDTPCDMQLEGGKINLVEAFIRKAQEQIGKPYAWGEASRFDGSGLISWALTEVGIKTPQTTSAKLYATQTPVTDPSIKTLRRGDLVYWGSDRSHVAIWLGNDQILEASRHGGLIGVHAMRWDSTVTASRLPESYLNAPIDGSGLQLVHSPLKGRLYATSPFGMRFHPVFLKRMLHNGLDLDADLGDPVYALSEGKVLIAEYGQDGEGNYVKIDYGGGITSRNMHFARIAPGIKPGVRVPRGGILGHAGTTGASTGVHLHITIEKNGVSIDPYPYLTERGLTITGRVRMTTGSLA